MTVYGPKRLRAHPEIARGFVEINAGLHQPSCACVPRDVRAVLCVPSLGGHLIPGLVDVRDAGAEVMNDVRDPLRGIGLVPAAKMRKKPAMDAHGRLQLLGRLLGDRSAMNGLAVEIDPAAHGRGNPPECHRGAGPRSRINANQQKPDDMAALWELPGPADAIGYLFPGQPVINPRFGLGRKSDDRDRIERAVGAGVVVVDGGAKRLEFVTGGLIGDVLPGSPCDVLFARRLVDLGKGLVAPLLEQGNNEVADPHAAV